MNETDELTDCVDCPIREREAQLQRKIEDLTPGGSDFAGSPDNCIRFIRGRLETSGKIAKERNELRESLSTMRAAVNILRERLKHGPAMYRTYPEQGSGEEPRWYMTEFTYQQFTGNWAAMQEAVAALAATQSGGEGE